jgi:LDH2 family malate/lactate/ureidoglycolate dehydrogenase
VVSTLESDEFIIVSEASLTDYATSVLAAAGLREEHSRRVASNLVLADMRGIDSHGVTRIPIYGTRVQEGVVNADPTPKTDILGTSFANVDGDNGPGAVVGHYALDRAMELAEKSGVGIALVRNSNHFGICADYALRAVDHGFVAMVATNSPTSMAIWGAGQPFLGTNPFAFAAPVEGKPHLVLDFASSVVARGKIVERAKRGESIPEGWALDKDGAPTTDARAAEAGIVRRTQGLGHRNNGRSPVRRARRRGGGSRDGQPLQGFRQPAEHRSFHPPSRSSLLPPRGRIQRAHARTSEHG